MLLICIASVLVCSAAEFSLVVPKASVSAQLGSSVVLPCSLSPPLDANDFTVKWSKNEDSEKMVLFYKDLKVQETEGDARYRDRVSLIGELRKGDTSLELKNLMMADEGEYVCFVHSFIWYEKGSVNLIVKVLGSPVLITSVDAGELPSQILMVNITCTSEGWYPKPTVTWRDSAGRELLNGSTHYTTDSEGLVSVSSWLLVSPSQSEWISCAVGLNHQEIRESRFVPLRTPNFTSQDSEGVWKEVLISTLVLSLIVLITVPVLLILFKKGLIPRSSSHKDAEAAVTSHESVPTETLPLITTGTSSKCGSPKPTEEPTEEKQTLKDSNEGSCLSYGAPEPTEEKPPMRHSHKVNSHESLLTDTIPHNVTENTKQAQSARAPEPSKEPTKKPTEEKLMGDSHEENTKQDQIATAPEPRKEPTEDKQIGDSREGNCLSYGAPEPTEEKPPMRHSHKENTKQAQSASAPEPSKEPTKKPTEEKLMGDSHEENIKQGQIARAPEHSKEPTKEKQTGDSLKENTQQDQSARAPEPSITENTKQCQIARAPEPRKEPTNDKQIGDSHEENTNQGQSTRAPEPTEEQPPWKARHKVSLTLDPSTAPEGLKVSDDGKSVYCDKRNNISESQFPYVVSKEEFGSGQHYWEVMVWDKTTGGRKSSWCVGVTQKLHTGNIVRALCYEQRIGVYTIPNCFSKIPAHYNMTKVGLHLNCERHSLNFYDADKTSNNYLYTFYNIPQGTYVAFLSPGVRDEGPIRILT